MAEQPCPFCELNTVSHALIYENSFARVISSNPRLMFGHTLVIPKKHVAALYELTEREWTGVIRIVFRYQKKLMAAFSNPTDGQAGVDVAWHTRPFMPTTQLAVPGHAHVHLRPRIWEDDYFKQVLQYEIGVFQKLSPEEIEKYKLLFQE